jgi:hypothetical protein
MQILWGDLGHVLSWRVGEGLGCLLLGFSENRWGLIERIEALLVPRPGGEPAANCWHYPMKGRSKSQFQHVRMRHVPHVCLLLQLIGCLKYFEIGYGTDTSFLQVSRISDSASPVEGLRSGSSPLRLVRVRNDDENRTSRISVQVSPVEHLHRCYCVC